MPVHRSIGYGLMLESGFESCPFGGTVVFRQVHANLIARFGFEIGNAGEQDAEITCTDSDIVVAAFEFEGANDLFARDGTNLFVEKCAVFGNGELEDVTLDEFGFASVVCGHGVGFAIRTDHVLAVEYAFDDFAEDFFDRTRLDAVIVADDAHQ